MLNGTTASMEFACLCVYESIYTHIYVKTEYKDVVNLLLNSFESRLIPRAPYLYQTTVLFLST